MKKIEQMPVEFLRVIEQMKREGRFIDALREAGFKTDFDVWEHMHHVKHEILPISCSFQMLPRTLHIYSFTDLESGNWIHPSSAFYERDGHHYVTRCSRFISIIEPENFVKMLIYYARQMANEILNKLDSRAI